MTRPPEGPRARITYLATTSGLGGAEQQVRALAQAFARRQWEVGVVSMLPLEPLFESLRADGVRVESLDMRQGIPDPRALVALARIVRRWKPEVLHAHMVHANLLARIVRLIAPVPVVVSTLHNEDEGAQWRYVAYRLTDRLSDATTAVSRAAVSAAVRRGAQGARPIQLVPNGIATDQPAPGESERTAFRRSLELDGSFVWLAVGRLTEAKGYPDLIRAFSRVAPRHPTARLLIAGEGELQQELAAAVADAGLADRVRLLGRRDDIPLLMAGADAFVLSSAWEGLPMVLLEAASRSLPIVATDVGGTRDVVLQGTGIVVPPRNPPALAEAMLRLMTMPATARLEMGRAGRAHVKANFELEAVVDRWSALYLSLLAKRAQR